MVSAGPAILASAGNIRITNNLVIYHSAHTKNLLAFIVRNEPAQYAALGG